MTYTKTSIRRLLCGLIAPCFLLGAGASATAQETYPTKPITFVVGFAPGTSTDIVARIVAEGLTQKLSQPVIVENRPGANGMRAAKGVAEATPDGYTILASNTSGMTLNPLVYKDVGYSPLEDYAPIGTIVSTAALLITNPEGEKTSNVETLADLFEAGKTPPGLSYPSHGIGNLWHLAGAELAHVGGFEALHVPYSSTLMRSTLIGKEVDFAFDTLAAVPTVKSGELRALAIATKERRRQLPDVPTFEELGYPSLTFELWTGLMAPAGTPTEIVELLNQKLIEVAEDPALREKLMVHGDIHLMTPDELLDSIAADLERNAVAMERANVTPM